MSLQGQEREGGESRRKALEMMLESIKVRRGKSEARYEMLVTRHALLNVKCAALLKRAFSVSEGTLSKSEEIYKGNLLKVEKEIACWFGPRVERLEGVLRGLKEVEGRGVILEEAQLGVVKVI